MSVKVAKEHFEGGVYKLTVIEGNPTSSPPAPYLSVTVATHALLTPQLSFYIFPLVSSYWRETVGRSSGQAGWGEQTDT